MMELTAIKWENDEEVEYSKQKYEIYNRKR